VRKVINESECVCFNPELKQGTIQKLDRVRKGLRAWRLELNK